jgi:hypothetical protein
MSKKKYLVAVVIVAAVLGLLYYIQYVKPKNSCSGACLAGVGASPPSQPSPPPSDGGVTVTYYYNPGCPHCRNFMGTWKDFSSGGGANFQEVNCAQNPSMCQNVRGVPFIVFSKDGVSIPYMGQRDMQSLQNVLNSMS